MNKIYNDNCLVKLNEERFYFHSFVLNGKLYAMVSDKVSFKPIVRGIEPLMILEVLDDEILVNWNLGENRFKFQHLCFDRDNGEVVTKYEKEYAVLSNEDNVLDDKIKFKSNLVIIEEENNITIYNYKNNKNLVLNKFEIVNCDALDSDYLIGKIDVRNGESVIFNIDSESLDVDRIYSVMQDRFIKVDDDRNLDLRLRMLVTLENEIYPDLERVEEFNEYMCDKKVYRACKKLIKSNK